MSKKKHPVLKVILIVFGVIIVISVIAGIAGGGGSDSDSGTPVVATTGAESGETAEAPQLAPIQEPETTVPHQSELLAYIEKEMYILDDNGYFNTIVIRPFEFEITEYRINNKNRISSIAIRVYYTDMSDGQNSQLITYTAVQIVINWLVDNGFDPFEEWIDVTCHGYFRETGATGQSLLRTWGYSEYDWNSDFITWKPATN
jgi:hypothetical protein